MKVVYKKIYITLFRSALEFNDEPNLTRYIDFLQMFLLRVSSEIFCSIRPFVINQFLIKARERSEHFSKNKNSELL